MTWVWQPEDTTVKLLRLELTGTIQDSQQELLFRIRCGAVHGAFTFCPFHSSLFPNGLPSTFLCNGVRSGPRAAQLLSSRSHDVIFHSLSPLFPIGAHRLPPSAHAAAGQGDGPYPAQGPCLLDISHISFGCPYACLVLAAMLDTMQLPLCKQI